MTLRDYAFTVTDGTVTRGKGLTQGSNTGWTITVTPDSAAAGAACTGDGRMLSNRLELTVSAPGQQSRRSIEVSGPEGSTGRVGSAWLSGQQARAAYADGRRRVPDHRLSQQRAKRCRNTLPQSKGIAIAKVWFGTYQSDEEALVFPMG